MKRQIVNIINFVRAVEPRSDVDLLLPVVKQLALAEAHGLASTFLVQYDALLEERLMAPLKAAENIEIGLWFEVVRPLAEAAGLIWRGRAGYDWDWHAHVGFSVGYTPAEREQLIDVMMARFRDEFGYYPKSVGSWIIDAHSLQYMHEKYGVVASCNCKDQWGTDGYTLWGGPYGQAYYPSKENAYTPAQNAANQIDLPIFKMLGSDPVYQYDCGLRVSDGPSDCQLVVTLEPVYTGEAGGGGVSAWVDWYLDENFNGTCVTFGYTQAGQENSFGWPAMEAGLVYQYAKIADMAKTGKAEVITLAEAGAWFRAQYAVTPPASIAAFSDWKDSGKKSLWYSCKNYRINLYAEGNRWWIRDWHIYDECYRERYMDAICEAPVLAYDNLPVIDGNRWSGSGIRAGIYPIGQDGDAITFTQCEADDCDNRLTVRFDGFTITCAEDGVTFINEETFTLRFVSAAALPLTAVCGDKLCLCHNHQSYGLFAARGTFANVDGLCFLSDDAGGAALRVQRDER